jgi:hypothetical protein
MKHETTQFRHPVSVWLLKALLLCLSISAMVPGVELMLDPSGKIIQFPDGYLAASPFKNYFIPGFLLSVFVGGLALFAWFALWKKPKIAWLERINPFAKRHWAWTLALCCGLSLMIWIAVQVTMVPYFFLQPLMFAWGTLIVLLCLTPGVQVSYYTHPWKQP